MARTKQTARKSTGGKAPRKDASIGEDEGTEYVQNDGKQVKSLNLRKVDENEDVTMKFTETEAQLQSSSRLIGTIVQSQWKNFYNNPVLSDIKLKIGSEELFAHRLVLSCWGGKWEEVSKISDAVVTLGMSDEEKRSLKTMVEYMYRGATTIGVEQLLELIEMCHVWGMTPLKEECGSILFQESDKKNLAFLLDVSHRFHCTQLETSCANTLAQEFRQLVQIGSIFDLPLSTWKALVQSDSITVQSELELFGAIFQYAEKSKDKGMVLETLLPFIRYGSIPPDILFKRVEPLVEEFPFLQRHLYDAYRKRALPGREPFYQDTQFGPRNFGFSWDRKLKSKQLKTEHDSYTITHKGNNNTWLTCLSSETYSTGVHSWKFKIDMNTSQWIFIGICKADWTGYLQINQGYVGHDQNSWSYGSYQGWGRTHGGSAGGAQPGTYATGDTVTISADFDQGTLSFCKNDGEPFEAFQQLPSGEYRVGVTLYNAGEQVTYLSG